MIPRTQQAAYTQSWQDELKSLITCPKILFKELDLPIEALNSAILADKLFKIRVTRSFASRMKKGDLNDPLLKQILPTFDEAISPKGYSDDPLAEHTHNPVKGIIHKYAGRVLLISANQCAVNCRYCFRRSFDYQGNSPSKAEWQKSLDYIRQDASIREVILSGGDPLVLGDSQIDWLLTQLEAIKHLTRVRFHSRLPIVLPQRITAALLDRLSGSRLNTILVIHSNHPNEIDQSVHDALIAIKIAGITVLNQSVLLAGVNDNSDVLAQLSEQLFDAGTLPYYLHLMDKVNGAAHFDIPEIEAVKIHQELLAKLPGFLVPKLVKEVPHKPSKISIF